MLGHFTLHTYLVPYLGGTDAAPALLAFGAAGILGVWTAGLLADGASARPLLAVLGLHAAAMAALPLTSDPAEIVVIAAWGAAYAALPMLQTRALRATPHTPSAASALFIIAFNLGITSGSLLGGQTLAPLGAVWLPAAAVPLVLWAGAIVAVQARRQRLQPDSPAPSHRDDEAALLAQPQLRVKG
jgi:predicted MFS family arabinose efflux permease